MSDHEIRPDTQAFLDMLQAADRPNIDEIPIEQYREMSAAGTKMSDAEPRDVKLVEDHEIDGPGGKILLRYYDNREVRDDSAVLLFIHGGGFCVGSVATYDPLVREYAIQTGLPVISVEYRLAPEHPFPAAPDDCEAAARFIASGPDFLPFTVTGLAISGDSAGGNLTIVTALALAEEPAAVPVKLIAPIYPLVNDSDTSESMKARSEGFFLTGDLMMFFGKSYGARRGEPRHHLMERDWSALPPTLVMTATLDPLHDQGVAFFAALQELGVDARHVEAEGVIHGFINMRRIISSGQADLDRYLAELKAMSEQYL